MKRMAIQIPNYDDLHFCKNPAGCSPRGDMATKMCLMAIKDSN